MDPIGSKGSRFVGYEPVRLELDPDPVLDSEKAEEISEPTSFTQRARKLFRRLREEFFRAVASAREAILSVFRGKDTAADPLRNIFKRPDHSQRSDTGTPSQTDRQSDQATIYFSTKRQTDNPPDSTDAATPGPTARKPDSAEVSAASKKMLSASAQGIESSEPTEEDLKQRASVDALFNLLHGAVEKLPSEHAADSRAKLEDFLRWSSKEGVNSSRPRRSLLDGENVAALDDVGKRIDSLLDDYFQRGVTCPKVLNDLRGPVSTLRQLLSRQAAQAERAPVLQPEKRPEPAPVSHRQPRGSPPSTAPVSSTSPEPPRRRIDDAAALKRYAQFLFPQRVDAGLKLMQRFAEFSEQNLFGKPVTASGFELHELFMVLRALDEKQVDVAGLDTSERFFLSDGRDRLRKFLKDQPDTLFFLTDERQLPIDWRWPTEKLPVTALNDEEIIQIRAFLTQVAVKDLRLYLCKLSGLSADDGEKALDEACKYLQSVVRHVEFSGNIDLVRKFMFRWAVQAQLGNMKANLLPQIFRRTFLPELVFVEPESDVRSEIERAFSSLGHATVGVEKFYQSRRQAMLDFVAQDFERLLTEFRLSDQTSVIRRWRESLTFRLDHLALQDADEGEYELQARVYPDLPEDDFLRDVLVRLRRQLIDSGLDTEEKEAWFRRAGELDALLKLHSRSLSSDSDA